MAIEDLVSKYLLTEADVDGSSVHPFVPVFDDSMVTPLIDGDLYFEALYNAITKLEPPESEQAIYIASWYFNSSFAFDESKSDGIHPTKLIELLGYKVSRGVDVRVLIWVSDFVLATGMPMANIPGATSSAPFVEMMVQNLRTIEELRSYIKDDGTYPLADRVIANTLDHPYGAAHTKFVLVVDRNKAKGFTGGIDLAPSRFSGNFHGTGEYLTGDCWHDVMAMVEGDACQAMYDFFLSLWNALAARVVTPSASPRFRLDADTILGTPVSSQIISSRDLPSDPLVAGLPFRVQSLRTFPNQQRPFLIPFEPTLDFAPNGLFETEQALRKAIAAAEKYIYVEDQGMQGRAVFGWLNAALRTKPNLKVVLLTGQLDPADPPRKVRNVIIRDDLLAGLSASEISRVVFFVHQRAIIHSKLWLIDDAFALIGSANIFNRGMYIEIEHGVSFVEERAFGGVRDLRQLLWGEHFRLHPLDRSELESIETSLAIWNPAWASPTAPAAGFILPFYTDDFTKFQRPWGGLPGSIDPLDQIPSLTRLNVPLTDATGQPETTSRDGHTYRKWRGWNREVLWNPTSPGAPRLLPETAGPVEEFGADFIDDMMLPWNDATSGSTGLIDQWFYVFHVASSTTLIRKITRHIDRRIFFAPLPMIPDVSDLNTYGLLTPVLRGVSLPPDVPFDPSLAIELLKHDWLEDPKPW
jgi:phosphatidylserine/phosphatidylglycerophosphate/cardiolipin synthase-like enzyme